MWGSSLKQRSSSSAQLNAAADACGSTGGARALARAAGLMYSACNVYACVREQRSTDDNGQCGRDAALAALEGGNDRGPHSRRRRERSTYARALASGVQVAVDAAHHSGRLAAPDRRGGRRARDVQVQRAARWPPRARPRHRRCQLLLLQVRLGLRACTGEHVRSAVID